MTRTFNRRASATYRLAVAALEALAEAEGPDAVTRAFAEAVWERRREGWAARHGLKPSGGHPCAARLLGGRQRCRWGCCPPPGADHVSLWHRNGRPAALVSQPYMLPWRDLAAVVDYCRRWGLEASVTAGASWHFPGETLLLEFRPPAPSKGGGPHA